MKRIVRCLAYLTPLFFCWDEQSAFAARRNPCLFPTSWNEAPPRAAPLFTRSQLPSRLASTSPRFLAGPRMATWYPHFFVFLPPHLVWNGGVVGM